MSIRKHTTPEKIQRVHQAEKREDEEDLDVKVEFPRDALYNEDSQELD